VIAVYDYGVTASGPFYTMELLDGGDLRALAPLPAARACSLIGELCSSIALLHARRLVHRDITPRNIRCTQDGARRLRGRRNPPDLALPGADRNLPTRRALTL
jgi:serine/threonine protein kinase